MLQFKKGTEKVAGLDRCHLKGPFGGVLLSAISLDGNNGLFPLAYAVVEGETNDSWAFFLTQLKDVIVDEIQERAFTFMSDGQKV